MQSSDRWVLGAALLTVACSPNPSTDAPPERAAHAAPEPVAVEAAALDRDLLAGRIKRYFESSGQISPDVSVAIRDVADAEVEEIGALRKVTLHLSTDDQEQEVVFLVSSDGQWFLPDDPIDLTVDPIAQVVDSITIGPDDPVRGSEDARVTIVEYSDFQCPFCARAETIVQEELLEEYGDKVKFVYKQMPLVSIHPWAQIASEVGLCVLRQRGNDAYWKYHSSVFAKQREIQTETAADQLVKLAAEAGGDPEQVKQCHEADETEAVIVATLEEAEVLGVNSTPTFFINGRRLSGAQPLDAFKAIIDPALAGAS